MNYNPYDLIPTTVNGQELQGRPIEFDSEVTDNQNMTNAFGNIVKPTRISTVCPDCGQGLEYDCTLGEPPFALSVICYHCNPDPPPAADPFMNPLADGRVGEHELDPLLHDPNEQVVGGDDESVEDKFPDEEEESKQVVTSHGADALLVKAPETVIAEDSGDPDAELPIPVSEPPEATEEASDGDTPSEPQDTPEVKEEPKKTPRKAKKAAPKKKATKKAAPKKKSTPKKKKKVPIEPADGLTEEVEFDDDDLAEIE